MDERIKEILMQSIIHDDGVTCLQTLKHFNLVLDESYFDYELLKAALVKKNGIVACFLVWRGCRVRNPSKIDLEDSPLHLAMKLDEVFLFVLLTLLQAGASIYDKNLNGHTPLQAAFNEKCYSAVDVLLDCVDIYNSTFNPDNKNDVLHFHIACIRKNITSVKQYLACGFDVNSYLSVDSPEFSGLTPLHFLVSQNDYGDLFKIFLDNSDLSIKNSKGLTPLHSIYYNCEHELDEYEFHHYLPDYYKIVTQVFKSGNDTKFINAVDNNGVSHFHLCCSVNCPELVQIFIDKGVDVNSCISSNCSLNAGFSPLHFAIKYGSLKNVELLLKYGADCNKSDSKGTTPLHLACANCETDEGRKMIEILLDYSACPIAVDQFGSTPIHLMFDRMWLNDSEEAIIFNKLISKVPLKYNLTDKNGLSLFHIICTRNDPDQVNDFLNSGVTVDNRVFFSSGRFGGYSALHFAVLFNQKAVVEVLLKKNAQVNIKTEELFTPLHFACEFNRPKSYDVYCQYEEVKSNNERPSLDWIPNRTSQLDIIKLLLQYGANIQAKSNSELSPLFTAYYIDSDAVALYPDFFRNITINEIYTRLIEITNILLSNKAEINYTNLYQFSIFHIISLSGLGKTTDKLMECLIAAGADINAVDKDGLTPLHHAAQWGVHELLEMFLKYKANVNVKCKNFQTPLKIAIKEYNGIRTNSLLQINEDKNRKSYESCIKILLENGSDVNTRTQDGRTLLHDAVTSSSTFLIENLLYHGADINVEDSLGHSIVCSLIKDGEIDKINISLVIFSHVQKLLALGLYVNNKVQKFCIFLYHHCKTLVSRTNYSRMMDNAFHECIDELNKMKIKMIDNYTSLYNILLKEPHELSKHVRNESLIEILERQNIDEQFPLYSYLLKLQYKKGLSRSDVLKYAKDSLMYVAPLNLPDVCCDSIFKYLSDEEIMNLKGVIAVKNSSKRKLNDNENKMEPSIKLQKLE